MLENRSHRLRCFLVAGILVFCSAADGSGAGASLASAEAPRRPAQQAGPEATVGLGSIYEPGFMLEDRNGDGHIDFVVARFALPQAPSDAEVAAAADIAARLGFETSAMNLPLARVDAGQARADAGAPVIAIGAGGAARAGVAAAVFGELEPGAGMVWVAEGPGGPVVVVAGGDDDGTLAAAMTLGARLPHIWDPDGTTIDDVVNNIDLLLALDGVVVLSGRAVRLMVEDGVAGLRRLDVEVSVATGRVEAAAEVLNRAAAAESEAAAETAVAAEEVEAAPEEEPGRQEEVEAAPEEEPGRQEEVEGVGQQEQAEEPEAGESALALRFPGLRLLRIAISAPEEEERVVWVTNESEPEAATGRRPGGETKGDLDLSNLYSNEGFMGDSDGNLIPDRVDVLLSAAGDRTAATADLAARLGLEAAGVTLPIAKPPEAIDEASAEPPLVLIGDDHPLVAQLVDDEKLALPELQAGQGWIKVVEEAFDEKSALVIVGGDEAGLERAIRQVAETFPHIHERGKDRPTVEDVEEALWKALSSRSPGGQAATALYKLDSIVAGLVERDLESVGVSIHVEKADPGLEEFVRRYLADRLTADEIDVAVDNIDVQNAHLLIDEEIAIPSEVDDFWQHLRAEVLPAVRRGLPVHVQAGLSEPPEVRAAIADRARQELVAAGADPEATRVEILSAYKQGYSWLYDSVRPALEGQAIRDIQIRFAEVEAPQKWPQQAMFTPTRWLLEIFPIDEVLARDLGLDLEQVVFEKMPPDAPAYEVIATGVDGTELLRETFEPRWVLRPYFDRFPDYEKVRVTTGWIRAEVDGTGVIDERIVTDLERFWDHFQGNTLMRIYDYVMRIGEGKPRAADAPHFGELRIEVSLSEPEYKIGVDNEQIASMEALHEEIYFGTLHFFDVLGRLARGQALNYPGRVIPVVRPKADGQPGWAKISFTGFGAARPMVAVEFRERGRRSERIEREIPDVSLERPKPLEAYVRDGTDGIERLGFYVKVDFENDRRDEFVRRTSARNVDARITSAAQTSRILENIGALREAGLYRQSLAFADLGEIDLVVGWEHERSAETEVTVRLPANGVPRPPLDIADYLPDGDGWRQLPLVQWDTPMPPPEAYQVLAKMSTFAGANAYQVGESYLGKPIWALDMMAPLDGSHWSQAKATTLKPTVIYSARQHANEVSSTSHTLKLAELILTEPEYEDVLDVVNVVFHPITNPDGAQLAYDLYQITPDHMLHAGYLGALGVDVTSGQGSPDPIYPETNVRPKLWLTWLPDIFLNPHGYPSHEWVQIFSEYAGWVRNRATESRGWWGMRGWFMPGFSYLDDPEYPDHKTAAFEIRDRITEKINGAEQIRALNQRAYDRYRRYAFAWDQDNFKLDFTDDVLIYTQIKGSTGRSGTMSNPKVTVWSGTTEAPDETAYGDWLQLVATAGLEWDKALLEYLLEGNHQINRTVNGFVGGVSFKLDRPRPAKPADEATEQSSPAGGR